MTRVSVLPVKSPASSPPPPHHHHHHRVRSYAGKVETAAGEIVWGMVAEELVERGSLQHKGLVLHRTPGKDLDLRQRGRLSMAR